jgi:hypothetical protein
MIGVVGIEGKRMTVMGPRRAPRLRMPTRNLYRVSSVCRNNIKMIPVIRCIADVGDQLTVGGRQWFSAGFAFGQTPELRFVVRVDHLLLTVANIGNDDPPVSEIL